MKKMTQKLLIAMRKKTRSEKEIFQELSQLCTTPGYIHVLAHLMVREHMIHYKDVRPR